MHSLEHPLHFLLPVKGTDFLRNINFISIFEISREKSRKIEKNQNNLRKFEKMKFLEKIGQITLRDNRDCRPVHANMVPEFFPGGNMPFGR